MAIAVTGAYGQVSTLACRRLAGTPIEVLALKQDDWADAIAASPRRSSTSLARCNRRAATATTQ